MEGTFLSEDGSSEGGGESVKLVATVIVVECLPEISEIGEVLDPARVSCGVCLDRSVMDRVNVGT